MKNWELFGWAMNRMKIVNGEYVKCIENGYRENDISLSQLHDALIELYDNEEYYENGW